ncbi:MAG: SDR family oxidoreductase, partial [Deltaproteobacteria bacterium]|nr:SDR family oxidoreductase [Deltaproteobacteria bacterium]
MDELAGKVAIVTGGASGIGRATVAGLLQHGAAVAVLDRDEAGAKSAADAARKSGGSAVAYTVDLVDTSLIPAIVERVLQQFGRIDILVNAAGVAGRFQTLVEQEESEWDFIHTVNLKASMLMMKHV